MRTYSYEQLHAQGGNSSHVTNGGGSSFLPIYVCICPTGRCPWLLLWRWLSLRPGFRLSDNADASETLMPDSSHLRQIAVTCTFYARKSTCDFLRWYVTVNVFQKSYSKSHSPSSNPFTDYQFAYARIFRYVNSTTLILICQHFCTIAFVNSLWTQLSQ